MSPLFLVGGGFLLLCLGIGLGYLLAHGLRKREASKANDIQHELDDYKQRVTEHFAETAEHFQAIGQQYRSLYNHMASGADGLCDATKSAALLGFAASDPAVVTSVEATDADVGQPQVIRDYAPNDDNGDSAPITEFEAELPSVDEESVAATKYDEKAEEEAQIEPDAEIVATTESDKSEVPSGEDETAAPSSAEEIAAEKIAESKPVESERTVH